ncbi:hypothetical protein CKM354_001063600 [Cercospora kikuchii]|uniref:Uncharacterized protein n=1 Tax=Cercospora kikuchii TaxID=84275 RepID=A0A9P3CZC6_9PEZI|nr:uncharacterized protein CKM354_001063600 [Cercospora kikuchii]GIZ47548.1 hypothetical protein CKM354_001063600 [Cercospora kikuchii]
MLSILFLLCAAVLQGVRAQVEAKPKSTVRVQITQRIQLTKTVYPSGVSAGVQDTTTATPAVAGGVQFTASAGNDAVPTTTSDEPRVILMGSITLTEGGPAQTNAGQVYSIDACTIYVGTARDNICDSNGRPTTESWTTSSAYPGITSDPATPTTTSWTFTIGTQPYTMVRDPNVPIATIGTAVVSLEGPRVSLQGGHALMGSDGLVHVWVANWTTSSTTRTTTSTTLRTRLPWTRSSTSAASTDNSLVSATQSASSDESAASSVRNHNAVTVLGWTVVVLMASLLLRT